MVTIPKTVLLINPKVNDKWYNIRRFMGEKTQENLIMGYSAAYPTGAERIAKSTSFSLPCGLTLRHSCFFRIEEIHLCLI